MQPGDSSKKFIQIHPRKIFYICSPFRIHPKSELTIIFPSHHFQVLSEIFQGCISTKPIGKNHPTKPSVSEDTKVTWNRNQGGDCDFFFFLLGKPWISGGFFFCQIKQRWLDWFCWKWKKWMEVVGHVFFFCNIFFCFRFLVANGFCNYWFEPVLKIFSVPKTSFLLWKSAIPKRNLSPNHHFLGAMFVLRCLFS